MTNRCHVCQRKLPRYHEIGPSKWMRECPRHPVESRDVRVTPDGKAPKDQEDAA